MNSIEHGTINGYTNHKCRCDDCRKASADYQRERVRKRQAAYFADKACIKCGSRDKMHNHHRDPTTKAPRFNTVWTWDEARREEELAKCDVLCASCHAILHNKERLKPIVHGTFNAYTHRSCRCDLCRTAYNAYQRAYQKQKTAERPKAPRGPKPKPIKHGTYNAYVKHKCRCELCKAASNNYAREREGRIKQSTN